MLPDQTGGFDFPTGDPLGENSPIKVFIYQQLVPKTMVPPSPPIQNQQGYFNHMITRKPLKATVREKNS